MNTAAQPPSNMAQVLVVADQLPDGVASDQVHKLLQAIGCGRDQSETWFDRDGSWQIGARRGVWREKNPPVTSGSLLASEDE